MAILTQEQTDWVSRRMAEEGNDTFEVGRQTFNAAMQAIEDWYETNKAAGSSAIDTATSPVVFTNATKKQMFKWWMRQKFDRESV